MKKRVVCYYPYIGSPLKDGVFENPNSWEYQLRELLKKDNIEIHTYDIVPIKKADYVLVFDNVFYQNIDIMKEMYDNHKLENSVYINYEPTTGHAKNHDSIGMEKLSHIFNKIITFDDDIVDNKKFIKGNIANFFYKEKKYKNDFSKRKFITMITNRTNTDSIIELLNYYNHTNYYNKHNIKADSHSIYAEREKAATYFLKHCPNEFDLYGDLWTEKYKKVLKGKVSRDKKLDVLGKYKFAFSYDSYTNQNGYISEKIFDCFMAKTVPIYLGANNISKYIPKNCYILKNDFKSYKELYQYLNNMDEKTYDQYIQNIEKYLKSESYQKYFSSQASASIIYNSLIKEGKMNYEKALESLEYFEQKRKKIEVKGILYTLDKIYYDKDKISVTMKIPANSNIVIESNGLNNPIYKKTKEIEDISFYLSYKDKKLYIKVYDQNKKRYYKLMSYEPNKTREYGLLTKRKKTIYFYHYTNMNPIHKIFYIVFHNPKKIIKKIDKNNK